MLINISFNRFIQILFTLIFSGILWGCMPKSTSLDTFPTEEIYIWSGGVSTDRAVLGVFADTSLTLRFLVRPNKRITLQDTLTGAFTTDPRTGYGKIEIDGLEPGTNYTYQVYHDGEAKGPVGKFQTFQEGPHDFEIAVGSCQRTGSESEIFKTITGEKPLFFLNTGDYHYENINKNCTEQFFGAYLTNWRSRSQAELREAAPFVYMWDDHDFGPNNSDGSAPCRKEAITAYRSFVPHYPQVFQEETGPVSQSFEVGRVRFLLTDLRSQKRKPRYNGCRKLEQGTNFGSEDHFNWFFEEMKTARDSGQLVVWVTGIPFINHPGGLNYNCNEDDDWGGFAEERENIANFIKANDIQICILSGDAHMVAIDDGTNSDYATGGGAPIPVFQAGPLDKDGSYKGGPYSQGYRDLDGQYGIMRVKDDGGDQICVEWEARDSEGKKVPNLKGDAIRLEFCRYVQFF